MAGKQPVIRSGLYDLSRSKLIFAARLRDFSSVSVPRHPGLDQHLYLPRSVCWRVHRPLPSSTHGEWMKALARLGDFHFWSISWWPWWGAGVPLEYTYAPLVPALTALGARATHHTLALSFNQLSGATYCLTPVPEILYFASWKISLKAPAGYSFASWCGLLSAVAHPSGSSRTAHFIGRLCGTLDGSCWCSNGTTYPT